MSFIDEYLNKNNDVCTREELIKYYGEELVEKLDKLKSQVPVEFKEDVSLYFKYNIVDMSGYYHIENEIEFYELVVKLLNYNKDICIDASKVGKCVKEFQEKEVK